jgi:hypothetical protein
MAKLVHEVLEQFEKAKDRKAKVQVLKQNGTLALKSILAGAMDPKVEFLLPKGPVPFTASEEHNAPSNLLSKYKDFRYVVKGGPGERIPGFKRENIFLSILESIHPRDAELVVKMINKEKPCDGITLKIIQEAFPDIIRK